MVETSRAEWLRPRLEALAQRPRLVPEQARPVDVVSRCYRSSEMDTAQQREQAAAAARTAIAGEIESRWPGAPYIIRQGTVGEFRELDLDAADDAMVVVGVVYRFDR
ncbi:hypothetical protein FHX37_1403 [Haloactinospora alba]|uniref:Uncharacterized protein n=1 Tax=Haloactinospora alba TaxID=405555 RepID=A0A543NI29_9ACTN|nr:hypothetical protein [Haloactinospora alba]TQN31496.1 hypothetical protein FHX37_1403 [Haloactinospora alba]